MWQALFTFIIALTIVFGIILVILKKVLYSDTESSVRRLQESYEEVKVKKEELGRKLTEIETTYNQRKEEAEKVAIQIKDKAKEEATAIIDAAHKKAKAEGEEIINKALRTVNVIKDEIHKELEAQTVDLCGELLRAVLSSTGRDQVHTVLVGDFIQELKDSDMSKIGAELKGIDIVTFKPLNEAERVQIKTIISGKLKKNIELTEKQDEKILGGLIAHFGGLTLDGSLAARINEIVIARKTSIGEPKQKAG